MSSIQDLDQRFPIVGDDGRPTDYFMRLIKDRAAAQISTDATVAGKADKTETISTGTGLTGGGDLSAPRTISLTDTAVTPGTYGDATHSAQITVDQQGRITAASNVSISGGGGSPWWLSPPTAASMSLVSGDATNLTLTDDSQAGLLFDAGAPVTGDKCRFAYRTLTTPANDWVMTARLNYLLSSTTFSYVGLMMRDSAGGKCVSWKYDNNRTLANSRHTNLGLFNAAGTSVTILDYVNWFRITKSGANVTFSISSAGKQWTDLVTESATAFMAAVPNQVGFFVGYNKTAQPAIKGACEYFSLTGTAV